MTINVPGGISPPRVYNLTITSPGTIANAGTYTSDVIATGGLRHVAINAQIDQAGTLGLQRYQDSGGIVTAGTLVTASMTKNTTASIDNLGTVISQSAKITIVNGATTAATISTINISLQED